tara:strand:- start:408 stop:845 length:438 start_codon:yes stop_codon:yes gene_type:complete
MKRINEEANRPFKSGDVRQDGYIFKSYKLTLGIKKDGYYGEAWYKPMSYQNLVDNNKKRKARIYNHITRFLNKWKTKNGCYICQQEFRSTSLQFHHIDRQNKSGNVSEIWRTSWAGIVNLKKEIRKCKVVCYNCHTLINIKESRG